MTQNPLELDRIRKRRVYDFQAKTRARRARERRQGLPPRSNLHTRNREAAVHGWFAGERAYAICT